MNISFITPARNNLKYLKWSYASIRKNQGNHNVEICVLDDASTDGTWEWCIHTMKSDPMFKAHRNASGERWGHTIGYDYIINKIATYDVGIIFHADMYLCPNALNEVEKYMYNDRGDLIESVAVSLTRIEPPLHPMGNEKETYDWGVEPEEFNEEKFLHWFGNDGADGFKPKRSEPSVGIFAPWSFSINMFKTIGGHDSLFAPQSKEDSDIFNRMQLFGVKFIQTWKGFVYHMTCRGSRFNPTLTKVGVASQEWVRQNTISARNFTRKWGQYVNHDIFMNPIVFPKYDVGIEVKNCDINILRFAELYCSNICVDLSDAVIDAYCKDEICLYPIRKKFVSNLTNDIIIHIDGNTFENSDADAIHNICAILTDSGIPNTSMALGNIQLKINNMIPIDANELIYNKNAPAVTDALDVVCE